MATNVYQSVQNAKKAYMKCVIVHINKSKLLCLFLYDNHNATKQQLNIVFIERFR